MNAAPHPPVIAWGVIALAIVAAWTAFRAWQWYRRWRARRALIESIAETGTDLVSNVLVPDGMGAYFHIDFLLLTPRCVLVIDLRDVPGNVFGGDQMTEWTVMDPPERSTFANPQNALYDRVAAVKAIAGEIPVEGRVVFTQRARFPKGLPKWTMMIDSLGTEFPAVERVALAGQAPPGFFDAWARIKSAVTPSPLNP